jgi:hypothetical protein
MKRTTTQNKSQQATVALIEPGEPVAENKSHYA